MCIYEIETQLNEHIPNNPPAVIGVGGLYHLLRAAPPPALFPLSLLGKQRTGPPGGGQAAGLLPAEPGRARLRNAPDQKSCSKLLLVESGVPFGASSSYTSAKDDHR